jgi:polyisoprenoid-binding protein YceI
MKKSVLMLFVAAALSTACKKSVEAGDAQDVKDASAEAVTYTVDTAGSVIEWIGSKPIGKHNGNLKISSGSFAVKDGAIEGGNFILDMTSINVLDLKPGDGKEDLEGHLKGDTAETPEDADHFFNVRKYPEGKFEITGTKAVDGGKTEVQGNLTLKGISKSVSFPATISVTDTDIVMISDTFVIDRTQWKVNYASKSVFKDLSDKFVDDEVSIKITVKAKK